MIAKATVKMGNSLYEFTFDEGTEKEILNKIITFGNPSKFCKLCGNYQNFSFRTNKDKEGNIYIKIRCGGKTEDGSWCGAESKLGEYKTKGYFWHDFERYQKGGDDAGMPREDGQ